MRLSGPRNTIINVGPSDIKAYIDLSDAQEGEMSAPVRIEIPAGTELKKQSMTSADIMVDVYTVRELALTPHLVGQTKNDIFVSSLKVVPEKVVISGARRLVKQVEQAVVEIPIEDRIDDFSIMAPIRLVAADGSRVEGLEMTPWQSNIRISIGHNAVTKDIPVYVTTEGDVSPSVSLKEIKINPDTVAVKGDANILKNLSRIDLPPIDISGLKQDKKWKIIVSPVNGVIFEPDTIEVAVDVE